MAWTTPTTWTRGMLVTGAMLEAQVRNNLVALKARDDDVHVGVAFTLQPTDVNVTKVLYFDDLALGYNGGIHFDQMRMGYEGGISVRWQAVFQVVTAFNVSSLTLGGYQGIALRPEDGIIDASLTSISPGGISFTNTVGWKAIQSSEWSSSGIASSVGVVRPRLGVRLNAPTSATVGLISGNIIFSYRSYQP